MLVPLNMEWYYAVEITFLVFSVVVVVAYHVFLFVLVAFVPRVTILAKNMKIRFVVDHVSSVDH